MLFIIKISLDFYGLALCDFTPKDEYTYLPILRFITNSCNYTYHRAINMMPVDIKDKGVIRIYHDYEDGTKNPSQGSPISITRLAEWWQMVILRDGILYPILTRIMDSFSCSPLNTSKKDFQKIPNTPRCNMMTSFDITTTSRIGVRLACGRRAAVFFFFLSFTTGWYGYNDLTWVITKEIPIWCARKDYLHTLPISRQAKHQTK